MSKPTIDTLTEHKYTRKCLLHEIGKCDIIIHTNRLNQKFCCDTHRYEWHNNMRALFKRVSFLEEKMATVIKSCNEFGKSIESISNTTKGLRGVLKTITPDCEELQ